MHAQTTFTSTGTGGDWETGSTWDQSGATPGNNDHVVIADGDIVTIANATGNVVITDVTIQGTGNLNWLGDRRLNVNGDLTMSGTSSITGSSNNHRLELGGDFDIPSGTATIGGIRITADGTTTITGTLSFTSVDGNKTFTNITVATGGHWNNNSLEDFNIDGDIVANSGITWTGCSATIGCRYTIRTDGTGVSGAGTVTFSDLRINDNVTYTNTGNLVITDDIDGQVGTGASLINNGTLTLSDNGTYSEITFDLDNNPNTVIYAGAGNEDITLGPFHDLEINKTAAVQCDVDGANVTVNNDMTITEGVVRVRSANTLLVTGNLQIDGGELTILTNASAIVDVNGSVTVDGGEIDQNLGTLDIAGGLTVNTGTVNISNATLFNVTGTYQASGGTNDLNSGTATFGGLTVDASQTMTVGGITLTAGGTTLVNGTLRVDGNTGDKNLNNLTLSNSGNLDYTSNETVTVGGNLLMSGTSSVTATNASRILNVTGTFGVTSGTATFTGVTLNVTALTTIAGTLALTNGTGDKTLGALTMTGSGNVNFTADETLTIGGALTMLGTSSITGTSNNQIIAANSTFDVTSGTASIGGVRFTVTDLSTISGTLAITSGTGTKTLADLTITGSGNVNFTTAETLSVGGNLVMLGTSSITGTANNQIVDVTGNFGVTSGTASIGGVRFTIGGITTLDGALAFTSATGNKTFADITVNGSGTWNNGTVAEDFTISGDITNNGSWTGCLNNGCDYTLTSASGTISGSGAMNSTSDVIINTGVSYTNTNTGGLFVTDRLTGTGEFINGANGSLTYSGNNNSGTNFDITTFTASASGNTVTYARAGDMQLRATSDADNNYHNLVIDTDAGGDDITMVANVTVDNQLTLTQGEIILGAFNLTMEDGATITGGNTTSYIRINSTGRPIQNYSASGATLNFPIGEGADYSPITAFTLTGGAFGAGASVSFDVTDASHPNRSTSNTGSGGDDDGTTVTDFISRYWTVTPTNITSGSFDASYQYLDADVNGTEANMIATLYRFSSTFGVNDWLVAGTVNPTTNTVSLTGGDAFGDLYAMDNAGNRLPIVLLSFEVEVNERNEVELEWSTATEIGNEIFTIERSTNGIDFEPVLYKEGAGNSNEVKKYSALDRNPLTGRSYYRLKQTDFDGSFDYSAFKSVFVTDGASAFKVYPNPVYGNQSIKIDIPEGVEVVSIIDKVGRTVFLNNKVSSDLTKLSVEREASWKPGLYLVCIYQYGERTIKKLLIRD